MHSTTRRLSLIGIALLLTNCVETAADRSTPNDNEPAPDETAGSSQATDKRTDTRDSLAAVSSDGVRWNRGPDLSADARAYAAQIASRAGLRDPHFSDFRVSKGADGLTHVRLEQTHVVGGETLKVWGADVVVHATDTELVGLSGTIAANLDALASSGDARLDEAQVLALAKANRFGDRDVPTSRESVERIIYVDAESVPHVAFHSTFYNELEGGFAPGLWNHVFDATTGELLAKWNGIDTLSQASGPGGNPKYQHSWNSELDVEAQGSSYVMTTTRLRTTNLKGAQGGTGTDVTASSLTSFNDAAINDAHGFAEITLEMMKQWMGHNSIDDNGFRILSRVHYGTNYENAFWDGKQMTYGDGKNMFYALSGALDVVAHEINHGFTSNHSNLGYSGQAGGLNESFSDIAGKTAEFFYKPNPTFDLGTDVLKTSGALRYMCTPSKDGRSIENISKMTPSLDPHYSSGLPNKVFCRLSKRLSSGDPEGTASKDGVKRAASAFYLANAHYWTSSATFAQACQGTVDAARSLGFTADEVTAIKTSWADTGVYCDGATTPPPGCDETLTGVTGTVTSPNYPNNYGNNFTKTWCIDAPAGKSATLTFSDFKTESGYDFVSVADKTGKVISKTSGSTKPTSVTSSRIYLTFTSDEAVVAKGWKASWTSQ